MSALLLYDADCGFCMRVVGVARRLPLEAGFAPLQEADLAALGVDPDRARREMPAVLPDGAVVYGHAAIAAGLLTGRLPLRVLGRLLLLTPLVPAVAYRWVAGHRHRLPGGTAACAPVPPA